MSEATERYLDRLETVRRLRGYVSAGASDSELREFLKESDALLSSMPDEDQQRMAMESWRGWPDLHKSIMGAIGIRELDGLRAAVKIAREKGECYPTCNMPPPEIRKHSPSSPAWRAWREENKGKCTCWKAEMEAALKSKETL